MTTEPARVSVRLPDLGPGFAEKIQRGIVDVAGTSGFVELVSLEVAELARGAEAIVSCAIARNARYNVSGGYFAAGAEVQVVGYIAGGQRAVLYRSQVTEFSGPAWWRFPYRLRVSRLTIEARRNVDGVPDQSPSVGPDAIQLTSQITIYTR